MSDEHRQQRRARNAIIWLILGMGAVVGVVTLISAIGQNVAGEPLIKNLDVLIGTLMTSFAGVLMLILPFVLRLETNNRRIRADTKAIKTHVENAHGDNLRDDMDDKHTEIVGMIQKSNKAIEHSIDLTMGTKKDIRGMRRDIGRVQDHLEETDRRLRNLDQAHDAANVERKERERNE